MGYGKRAAALAVAAGVAAGAAPAEAAAAGYARCAEGAFCLFSDSGGQGRVVGVTGIGAPDLRLAGMDDDAESAWNRSDRAFSVFTQPGYAGGEVQAQPGGRGDVTPSWRDEISSARPSDGSGGLFDLLGG
ncbi:peptidase inhibitor family I36 protein [Nocardiopsis coralliicola]